MSKRTVIKNVVLLGVVVAVVYGVATHSGPAKSHILSLFNLSGDSVKGASTQKAQEVSGKLEADIGNGFQQVKVYLLYVTLGDAIQGVSRLRKIPQDAQTAQTYIKEQVDRVVQSRK